MKILLDESIDQVRADFPQLTPNLAYLDNAATTFKPQSVIDAESNFYRTDNANPRRGFYNLSLQATTDYENARTCVANFINAKHSDEIVFTKNATESLNLIALSLADSLLKSDDHILVSIFEHHSNLLPWQMAAKRHQAKIDYLYCDKTGKVDLESAEKQLAVRPKILAISAFSNVIGRIDNLAEIIKIAHKYGVIVVVDAAQAIAHEVIDVQKLDADFLVFSGHKIYGPMGIGVLYGKHNLLENIAPVFYGGEMVENVELKNVTLADIPYRFEAGTMNVAGAVGLAAAIKYLTSLGLDKLWQRERELNVYAFNKMSAVPNLEIVGPQTAVAHDGIVSFTIKGAHPHDVAEVLNVAHVAVRAGYHCAQPLLDFLIDQPAVRVSLSFYNTTAEIDQLAKALLTVRKKLSYE